MSHNAEKTERGPLGFFNIHSVAKRQKIEEGPFGNNFFPKKCPTMVGPFSLARYCLLHGKKLC